MYLAGYFLEPGAILGLVTDASIALQKRNYFTEETNQTLRERRGGGKKRARRDIQRSPRAREKDAIYRRKRKCVEGRMVHERGQAH